ncbi:MAG: FeoA domain-containing protein [Planctomycetota bacterium]|nr:FeoA domain-containing protein [Planctomycetota bacterium]
MLREKGAPIPHADRLLLLNELQPGRTGVIVEIVGGRGICNRLQAMGLCIGSRVRRVASAIGRGPVVVEARGAQFAIGFGMASRIIVEIENGGQDPPGRQP